MRSRLIVVGALAGGIALTGLAGSAYAAGASPSAPSAPSASSAAGPVGTAAPAKGTGPVGVICVGKGVKVKGKPGKGPEKGIVTSKDLAGHFATARKAGKLVKVAGRAAAPPPGAEAVKVTRAGRGTVKIGPLPKGVHCSQVKPGTKVPVPLTPTR
ncbi:hypothetical protein [Actinoallomurus acaciae]|uniref:Uncharacterized protein n=1 Tax=Actinoallomurus acaciae TaxID=502577 RepID=A0ABV5YDL7_9ACTN